MLLRRKRGFLRSTAPRAKTKALSTLFDLLVHVAAVFQAMDGAAQGAAALCVCKAAFSLLFLPSLAACNSPVSFCCCCLLLFTDLLVAAFLSFLCVFEPWLSQLDAPTAGGDVIALRFLLFLSHLYGAVLLLCPPMIAAEALTRLSRSTVAPRQRWMDSDCLFREGKEEGEEEEDREEEDARLSHAVSYICCLSLWLTVALDIRWRPRPELLRTSICLQANCSSLVGCLPTLHRVAATTLNPSLVAASALLVLLFLLVRAGSRGPSATPAAAWHGVHHSPEKTESSCAVHADFVLVSPERHLTTGGEEPPLTLTRGVGYVWPWRGFPWTGVDVITGLVAVLLVFVLPPVLSVNILLIRTVETLVELSVKSLLVLSRKGIAATPACKERTGEARRGHRLDAV